MKKLHAVAIGLGLAAASPVGTEARAEPAAPVPAPATFCATEGSTRFLCGIPKPEDLNIVPGTDWIVTTSLEGGIYAIGAKTKQPVKLFPSTDARIRFDAKTYATCKGPPDAQDLAHFNTLGINVTPARHGVHRLYVTRYPGASSVDVFELTARGRRGAPPVLTWVGCVPPPDKVFANSIVGTADGGFVMTSFYETGPAIKQARARAEAGEITGDAWSWRPGKGWRKIPGTESSGTNGIALSADERTAYISQWGSRSFLRVNIAGGAPKRDVIKLAFRPDNVHWGKDGRLLLAGHTDTGGFLARIDPKTLAVTELVARKDTADFAHMTGAIEIGDEIWVGTTRANRIAVYPLSSDTRRPLP